MNPTNREFEIVYSQEEMEQRIEQLKMHGYHESDIHVLAADKDVFDSYENKSDVNKQETDTFSAKFKSFFSGEDTVHAQLRELDLDESSIETYSEDIKKGAILLYTDGSSSSRERDNTSSFGDDSRSVDVDEQKRNTAFAPFGRDIERDGNKFNDEKIKDHDVKSNINHKESKLDASSSGTIAENSDKIYTSEVRREDQHGEPGYADKTKDSRLEGATIHPTTDAQPEDEGSIKEKSFDHEPQLESDAQQDDLNKEDGVNRRQDEPSPGVDPNLGPAPFGRDSEEENLIKENEDPKHSLDGHDDVDNRHNPRDARLFHEDVEKKTATPPTPRLF